MLRKLRLQGSPKEPLDRGCVFVKIEGVFILRTHGCALIKGRQLRKSMISVLKLNTQVADDEVRVLRLLQSNSLMIVKYILRYTILPMQCVQFVV